jgi:hypothetical protein
VTAAMAAIVTMTKKESVSMWIKAEVILRARPGRIVRGPC